jgi:septum formation protein
MIVLASTSPTRQAMLRNAGLAFTAISPDVDERELVARHPDWTPEDTALKLAEAKAIDVSVRHPDAVVIGADQVLALDSKVYAKPSSIEECRQHLLELRGKSHQLISSVACAQGGLVKWSHTAEALLKVRPFSDRFLTQYLDEMGNDCMSTVGGYRIEGLGLQLFEEINGDHFTILGLPLIALLKQLRSMGEILS